MLQLRKTTEPAPGLLACLPETRIGPSALFGETRTEPLAFLTERAHRTSGEAWPETTSDLCFFTQEDPVRHINLYRYAGNRPTTFLDPDGRRWLLSESTMKDKSAAGWIINAATEMVRRPSGRRVFQKIACAALNVVLGERSLNHIPLIERQLQQHDKVTIRFGATRGWDDDPVTGLPQGGLNVYLDREATERYAMRFMNDDVDGVTTLAHEAKHVSDYLDSPAKIGDGDKPISATGPAEQFGKAVYRETPDISAEDARKIVMQAFEDTVMVPQ